MGLDQKRTLLCGIVTVEASTTYAQQRQPVVIQNPAIDNAIRFERVTPQVDRLEQLQRSIDELKAQVEQLQQLREEFEASKPSRDEQVGQD